MTASRRAALVLWLALAAVVASCTGGSGGASAGPSADSRVAVVTTTTVFADMVRNVGGDLVNVTSLVPPNADVHTFSPRPSDIRALAGAKIVFMNGLGLDDWLTDTVASVASHAPVVQLAVNLPGADYIAGDGTQPANPHLWMDASYAAAYADRIGTALTAADPANAAAYAAGARAYQAKLTELDGWVTQQLAAVPAEGRRVVMFHDAFAYYARRYGLDVIGVAVEAPGQDPSAGYTARLLEAIRAAHVKAIFSEAQFPARLVEQLAREAGVTVVANLYDDSIGDPPVTGYEAIVRWDTDQFVKALS